MSFHKSNLGSFAAGINCDMDGYIPTEDDGPFDLNIDHGSERTHDEDGELTEYGQWWEDEGYPEWRDQAIADTAEAESRLAEWQESGRFVRDA